MVVTAILIPRSFAPTRSSARGAIRQSLLSTPPARPTCATPAPTRAARLRRRRRRAHRADGAFPASVGLTRRCRWHHAQAVSGGQEAQRPPRPRSPARSPHRGAELFVDASSGTGRLAWETVVSGWAPDGQTPSRLHVITDATTGAVLGSWDEIETVTGTGNSIYSAPSRIDTTLSGHSTA
jgi:hypothetical protein